MPGISMKVVKFDFSNSAPKSYEISKIKIFHQDLAWKLGVFQPTNYMTELLSFADRSRSDLVSHLCLEYFLVAFRRQQALPSRTEWIPKSSKIFWKLLKDIFLWCSLLILLSNCEKLSLRNLVAYNCSRRLQVLNEIQIHHHIVPSLEEPRNSNGFSWSNAFTRGSYFGFVLLLLHYMIEYYWIEVKNIDVGT